MKILKKNLKNQEISLKIENLEDIWTLSQIIDKGDLIKGKTERKIKIGDNTDRNVKVVRKSVFLALRVEKAEISENSEVLKVLGVITDGPDDVARGEHHSFNLEVNSTFTVVKEKWLKFQLERVNEATKSQPIKVLIVVFDREEAFFARLKDNGYEVVGKIKGDVQKKEEQHVSQGHFYKDIVKKIQEYDKDGKMNHVILASPGFWKEELMKSVPEDMKKKIVTATVSPSGERAFAEVMKRDELQKVLKENRASQESRIVDELLQAISKEQACYGLDETREKINLGSVKDLLITHKFLRKARDENTYHELEGLMIQVEKMDGKIHIISSGEAENELDSLSGIAGILRWKS